MNIAIVVYSHYSRDARVRRYAESLARKGFEVNVVCLNENYRLEEDKFYSFNHVVLQTSEKSYRCKTDIVYQ